MCAEYVLGRNVCTNTSRNAAVTYRQTNNDFLAKLRHNQTNNKDTSARYIRVWKNVLCEFEFDLGSINSQQARRPLLPLWQVIVIVARSCWLASRGFYATTSGLRATLNCGHFDCGWDRWCCFIACVFFSFYIIRPFFLCGNKNDRYVIFYSCGDGWWWTVNGWQWARVTHILIHIHTNIQQYWLHFLCVYVGKYYYCCRYWKIYKFRAQFVSPTLCTKGCLQMLSEVLAALTDVLQWQQLHKYESFSTSALLFFHQICTLYLASLSTFDWCS